jgi:hypothetical protein
MKTLRSFNIGIIITIFAAVFLIAGCADSDDDDNSTTGAATTATSSSVDQQLLFAAVKNAGPVVDPSESSSKISAPLFALNWESGTPLYEIYGLIRDYVDSRDSGVIDGSNMYKAMYDSSRVVSAGYPACTTMDEKAVDSPFAFGSELLTQTYDCAYSFSDSGRDTAVVIKLDPDLAQPTREGDIPDPVEEDLPEGTEPTTTDEEIAAKADPITEEINAETGVSLDDIKNTDINFLISFSFADSSQSTREITQGSLSSGAIRLNSAYWVDYGSSDSYSVRIFLNGNTETGLFQLKLGKFGGTMRTSVVGYGYSKGAGNYYLFRVVNNQDDFSTAKYFCLEAGTSETEIMAMDQSGSVTVPANCSDLEANLPESDYDVSATSADVPDAADDFTGTGDMGVGLTY